MQRLCLEVIVQTVAIIVSRVEEIQIRFHNKAVHQYEIHRSLTPLSSDLMGGISMDVHGNSVAHVLADIGQQRGRNHAYAADTDTRIPNTLETVD